MGKVRVLILRAPGTNCDEEAAFAFAEAGAEASLVEVGELIRREKRLPDYGILVIPGGFTYGDDISAGKVLANELRLKLGAELPGFLEGGRLILGICNGFQILAKAGVLPGTRETPLTLTNNDSGRFECRWVYLKVNQSSPCVFTKDIERMSLPVAHGEGKVIALGALPSTQTVLFYTDEKGNVTESYPENPGGSAGGIAGICDPTGRVFALMPHPERHIRATQHPHWTRGGESSSEGDGFRVFRNAVRWASKL
ncbi:MAG: phosphoribosylformylglycinamidine synthase I [Chloroflexota bacterium]